MNKENTEIIKQLKSIRNWVAVGAIGSLLIGISAMIFSISISQILPTFEDLSSESEYEEENSEEEYKKENSEEEGKLKN